jgi:hypothetical protein
LLGSAFSSYNHQKQQDRPQRKLSIGMSHASDKYGNGNHFEGFNKQLGLLLGVV